MPPVNFEDLAEKAFDAIQVSLSTDAVYIPKAGGLFNIRGPFDDRALQVDPDTQISVSSNVYTFGLQLSDLPVAPKKGDKLVIKAETYQVIESREDGVPGVSAVLILHKVGA